MDKKNLAFGKINFIALGIGMLIVVIGLILMIGGGNSDAKTFDPEVFSDMHIKVAPVVTFIGFVSIIGAVMYRPKDDDDAPESK